ncbi:MAG: HAD family hydrolase, partial [Dehalococcoidia bacterium]
MALRAVFLDVDGVLVDADLLPLEYQRLMGDVLAPVLGGSPEDWGRANAVTFPALLERLLATFGPDSDPLAACRFEYVENVRAMCRVLGIREPDEDTSYRLGLEFNLHVRGAHGAVFPEAAPAVRSLAARYDVHLATGNPSWLCEAQLDGMGVRDAVGILCGPDLLGTPKHSPRYYPHLFALASVDPAEVVVVDDRPGHLD